MKLMYKKFFVIGGVILVIIIISITVMTYFVRVDSPLVLTVRKTLHLPAIVVDGHNISIAEIEENTASIKRFYENQDFSKLGIRIDFDTEDGQKRLKLEEKTMINKLIEDIAIEELAKEWDISISKDAVKSAMERPMNEMGTEKAVKQKLQELYGWTLNDFGEKVVKKQLLKEKVSAIFDEQNPATDEMRQKIQKAKKELDDNRVFADVAQTYSDGIHANEGGIMGWFADGQIQDEIGQQIFTMDKGEYTDIIETPFGLHIVYIDDITEVDGKKMVHLSQIVVKKQTLADFINEKIKKMNVKIFIPGYEWDAPNAVVIFADEDMKKFEQKILQERILQQQNTQEIKNNVNE
jgi:hypothetical protein